MGKYIVTYTTTALDDLKKHKKAGDKKTMRKISTIVKELENHPYTGVGNPKQLKHQLTGFWSRRINKKDRIIYSVEESIVTVEVISAYGHYGEK